MEEEDGVVVEEAEDKNNLLKWVIELDKDIKLYAQLPRNPQRKAK